MSKVESGTTTYLNTKYRGFFGKFYEKNAKQILELQSPIHRPESLEKPNYTGQRNVFISFSMNDQAQVQLLRSQAKDERFELSFRDYSAKEAFDSKWKTQMKEKMKLCSTTVCMIGEDTYSRPAVNWELEQAYKLNHKVIGVRIYRDANHKIPQPLIDHNAPIIDWNLGDIMEQINDF